MLDRTRTGQRVTALKQMRGPRELATVRMGNEGTIAHELDDVRHRIMVNWDQGFSFYVFPDEIEVQSQVVTVQTGQ